jgi:hypothetical protein
VSGFSRTVIASRRSGGRTISARTQSWPTCGAREPSRSSLVVCSSWAEIQRYTHFPVRLWLRAACAVMTALATTEDTSDPAAKATKESVDRA